MAASIVVHRTVTSQDSSTDRWRGAMAARRDRPNRHGLPSGEDNAGHGPRAAAAAPHRSREGRALQAKRTRTWLLAVALAAATALVYAGVGHHHFVTWDDPNYITANPEVLEGLTWRGVVWAFTSTDAANWHPLTWLSHMLDVTLFGMHAGAHHLVSVALHLSAAIMLFLFP